MLENLSADSVIEELVPVLQYVTKPDKPVLYFGRAIRGERENIENCRKIASEGEKRFFIISKHVLLDKKYDRDDIFDFEKKWKERFPQINVRQRDLRMIRLSDCFAADLTVESTGIGLHEIGHDLDLDHCKNEGCLMKRPSKFKDFYKGNYKLCEKHENQMSETN